MTLAADVNLLIYAYNSAASNHRAAKEWWEEVTNRPEPVGLPWAVACRTRRFSI
ncbi:MAG: hypothetical protein R6V85_12585 [Polyangia bacterium]